MTTISATYKWGIAQGLVKTNPATGIPKVWEYVPRRDTLPPSDLAKFYAALTGKLPASENAPRISEAMRDLILIDLLTFVRRTEAASARKSAVDLEAGLWTLTGDTTNKGHRIKGDTKNGQEHIVPLSTQALAVFKRAIERSTDLEYIFPSDRDRVKLGKAPEYPHIYPGSVNGAINEIISRLGIDKFTPHDLRRTAVTWAGENGIDDGVIRRLVNHVPDARNITDTTYNHALRLDERRMALQKWGEYLDALVDAPVEFVAVPL